MIPQVVTNVHLFNFTILNMKMPLKLISLNIQLILNDMYLVLTLNKYILEKVIVMLLHLLVRDIVQLLEYYERNEIVNKLTYFNLVYILPSADFVEFWGLTYKFCRTIV